MAMVISKFHRLIQSRLLWAAFLVVIVFSFVFWGTQTASRAARGSAEEIVPGRLAGKPVPVEEFRDAWHSVYVGFALRIGQPLRVNEQTDRAIRDSAWRRLVALREARRLGLHTGDDELIEAIRQQPTFQTNGQFDVNRYNFFIGQTLQQWGYTKAFFLEYIRGEITLGKLRRLIESAALVPPSDLDAELARITDVLSAEYVVIPRSGVETGVSATEADARATYDADPSRYTIPPKVAVRAVLFPWEPHLERVALIPEAELEDYYHRNSAEFRAPPTADAPDADPRRGAIQPFEDVRSLIEKKLREQAARARARAEADAFYARISPSLADRPLSFDDAAAAAGLTPVLFAPFSQDEASGEFPPGSNFHRAAFELRPNPDENFSDPIPADKGFYVLALSERIPARIPAFEEVAEQALNDARERLIAEALNEKARTVAESIRSGRAMADVAAELGLTVALSGEFTVMKGLREPDFGPMLVRTASAANPGEITDPIDIGNGRRLVLRLLDRRPGDPQEAENLRAAIAMRLRRENGQIAFEAWQETLLRAGRLEETAPRRRGSTDDE